MTLEDTVHSQRYIVPFTTISMVPFYKKLKKRMEIEGGTIDFVPQDKYRYKHMKKYVDDENIISGHLEHDENSGLYNLLTKYNIKSARRFVFPQMVYDYKYPKLCRNFPLVASSSPNYDKYLCDLHQYLDFFDSLYENGYQGTPVINQGGALHSQVVHHVAKKHDVSSIRYSFNPLPSRRSVRHTIDMEFPELANALGDTLSDNERVRAREYLSSIRKNMPEFGSKGDQSTEYVENMKNRLQQVMLYKGKSIGKISRLIYRSILVNMSKEYQSRYHLSMSDAADFIDRSDYVFFPLQYYRESRITLRSAPFFDQASLVEYLSRNVPGTMQLVVKDHPRRVGSLPNKSAKEISRFSNFVPPSLSAHKVIRNASAVVTLNNTVGHEALLWGKPVVTLGDALYSGTELTTDVHDIDKLDVKLSEAIDEGGPSEEEILRYINGLYRVSDPMVWGDSNDKNITNIVESIYNRNPNKV